MSAPQNTATGWLRYLVAYVDEHGKFPLVHTYFGDDELDAKLEPWRLVSVDIPSGTCTTMPDCGFVQYAATTDDLRIYIPPADTEADA